MKPVGLTDPHTGRRPYAVVQLRQDNALGTLFNMVGFQTKLKHGEQARIFRMIPGLERAEFARLGGLHRNTFLNSPRLLDRAAAPEGHAAPALRRPDHRRRGLCRERGDRTAGRPLRGGRAARPAACEAPPPTTALGALLAHITGGADAQTFQPMNINFGLFPPLLDEERYKRRPSDGRKPALSARALTDLAVWLDGARQAAA